MSEVNKTPKWLKGATYSIDFDKRDMIVDIPKSATAKRVMFSGEDQCDLVQCMFDELVVQPNQRSRSHD
jgi:hypothetical protein